jgi:hypothetical protein
MVVQPGSTYSNRGTIIFVLVEWRVASGEWQTQVIFSNRIGINSLLSDIGVDAESIDFMIQGFNQLFNKD